MGSTKAYLAELVGTFFFVFVGASSIIVNDFTGGALGIVGIAMAHGLALGCAVSATMNISGGQLNPAVSIGLLCCGKLTPKETLIFIICQMAGAGAAGMAMIAFMPEAAAQAVNYGVPALGAGMTPGAVAGLEIILTLFLIFAIVGTAVSGNAPTGLGGYGIGLTVAALILAAGPLTGAAMNPARHFGSALAAGYWDNTWVYWVGPCIGGALGFLVFMKLLQKES